MGFLLGAFGKLAAGRRYRELQARGIRVQAKLRRATKAVETMEKQLQKLEQQDKNALAVQKQTAMQMLNSSFVVSAENDATTNADIQKNYSKGMANIEAYITAQTERITNYYENMREVMLQPLKDEEDNLQLENDTIKSQIEIAKQDYEACQKMEQDGVKMLQPSYTAGGN